MSPTVEKSFISTLLLIIFAKWLHNIDYDFGPKMNRLVYRNVSLFLGKFE